ncbi:MAG: hypothetical protein OXC31_27265 [Spirochaetaceae bacterium]|nr:hypothetical protein [Spirochaetaceae bacterium]
MYFDPHVYRGLRIKAAAIDRTISDLVNEAVRMQLAEDADDGAAFDERANEPGLRFEDALNNLKRRGRDVNEVDDDRCVVTITKGRSPARSVPLRS